LRMLNGRQCVWHICKHFASPKWRDADLKCATQLLNHTNHAARKKHRPGGVLDKWVDCITNIRRLPRRLEYQDFFAGEMQKADVMKVYVREFDDVQTNDRTKTCEWLDKRGRIVFERDHQRENLQQTRAALDGSGECENKAGWEREWAAPAVAELPRSDSLPIQSCVDPKGKSQTKDKGEKEGEGRCKKGEKGYTDGAASDSSTRSWSGESGRQPKNTVATPADE
jgi:hypothetical protein